MTETKQAAVYDLVILHHEKLSSVQEMNIYFTNFAEDVHQSSTNFMYRSQIWECGFTCAPDWARKKRVQKLKRVPN